METKPVILFDLDGTLKYITPRMVDEFIRLLERLTSTPLTPKQIWQTERWNHYYWVPSSELQEDQRLSNGFRDRQFWLRYTLRHLKVINVPPGVAQEIVTSLVDQLVSFRQNTVRQEVFIDGAADTLRRLSQAGYRLGLVTNRDQNFPPVSLGEIRQYFEVIVSAGDVGYWKPDPRIFQVAMDHFQSSPQSTFYIGDNYYSDILGAAAAGLQPVLVDPKGLFPEAVCPVISRPGDIFQVLQTCSSQN